MRLGRRGVRALAIAAAVLVALIALILARAPIAEAAAKQVLKWRGVDADFALARLDFDHAVIEDLRVGPAIAPSIAAERIDLRYGLIGVTRGRLNALEADGLEVRATIDADGVRFAGLPSAGGGGGGGGVPPTVRIEDARFYADTPAGELLADFSVTGDPDTGWIGAATAYGAQLARGGDEVVLDEGAARFSVIDGTAAFAADVSIERATGAGGAVDALAATWTLDGAFEDPERLKGFTGAGRLGLSAGRVSIAPETVAMWFGAPSAAPETVVSEEDTQDGAEAAGEPAPTHLDGLRAFLAEALADVSVNAQFNVAAEGARLTLTPDGVAATSADDARLAVASAGEASGPLSGALVADLGARAATVRDLLIELSAPDGPNARVVVAAAGVRPRDKTGEIALSAALAPWRVGDLELGGDIARLRLDRDDDDWRATAEAVVRANGVFGDFAAADAEAGLDLSVERADGRIVATPRDEAVQTLEATRLALGGVVLDAVAGVLNPLSELTPLVEITEDGAAFNGRVVDASFGVERDEGRWVGLLPVVELAFESDATGVAATRAYAQAPRLEGRIEGGSVIAQASVVEASLARAETGEARVRFEGLSVSGTALPARFDRAAGELSAVVGADGVVEDGAAVLTGAEFHDVADRQRLRDVVMSGEGGVEDGAARGVLSAIDATGRELVHVDLSYIFDEQRGEIVAATPDFAFSPRGLQPSDVAPILRGYIVDASGAARARARLFWDADAFSGQAELTLDNLAFDTRLGRVEGLSTQFRVADALRFATDAPQIVRVDLLNPGIPLENGEAQIELLGGSRVRVAGARFPFAEGELSIVPVELDLADPAQRFLLHAEAIDLAAVNDLFRPPNLTVSGVLSGDIPIEARDGSAFIVDGVLRSGETGSISYTGRAAEGVATQNESTKLAFDALERFDYDVLTVTLNGDVAGRLDVGVRLEGRNPNLYDGAPINFNLNTSAMFASLLASQAFRAIDLEAARREALRQAEEGGDEPVENEAEN